MSTLDNFRDSLEKTWDSVSDGWRKLFQKTGGALTRFDQEDNENDRVAVKRVGWGLLNADMVDEAGKMVVTMEIPGLEPDDFDIQLNGDLLIVSGNKRYSDERHDGNYHIMECSYGSFTRSFHLPTAVDPNSVSAEYKNGVLHLTMEKTESAKKIAIKVK